jgi:hypothetical protein
VLPKKIFPRDYFGMSNILKAADRRIGLKRLKEHSQDLEQNSVGKVLADRRMINLAYTGLIFCLDEFP